MKKILCFVALLAMSFTTLTASAKTSELSSVKSEKAFKNVETKNVISEKLITYKIDNPILGNITISVPENAFNNDCNSCSFPVTYNFGGGRSSYFPNGGSGSFSWICDGSSMADIIDAILLLFFC